MAEVAGTENGAVEGRAAQDARSGRKRAMKEVAEVVKDKKDDEEMEEEEVNGEMEERELKTLLRPSIYPTGAHAPLARFSPLEKQMQERSGEFDVLRELKSLHMEGFYNLSMLLLVFSLGYNCVRNVREKGWLVEWHVMLPCRALIDDMLFAAVLCGAVVAYSASVFVLVRVALLRAPTRRKTRTAAYVLLQLWLYIFVSILVVVRAPSPLIGGLISLHTVVFSLKMHSYYATNLLMFEEAEALRSNKLQRQPPPIDASSLKSRAAIATDPPSRELSLKEALSDPVVLPDSFAGSLRRRELSAKKSKVANTVATAGALSPACAPDADSQDEDVFPFSLAWRKFAFFMFLAPTLVYEARYPRTERVRVSYITGYVAQMCIISVIQFVLFSQFVLPPIANSSGSFLFDAMRLAMPSLFVWLLGFYSFFHCALNAWAELTRFADREFYRDFWNATSLDAFWRTWNIPVHEWCFRHIFVESQANYSVSKSNAALATFVLSAVLHEYIFAISFRTMRPAMFAGMLAQVPFIMILRKLSRTGSRGGNLAVWINLFFGHPLIELLYLSKFLEEHGRFFSCSQRAS